MGRRPGEQAAASGGAIEIVGLAASEGIAAGRVRRVLWELPEVPAGTIAGRRNRARELKRFRKGVAWARRRLEALKEDARARLGEVEARIFDPQLLMLDDPEVVQGTELYIVENRLSAARAFQWRMLELRERWSRTGHPMVLDRLNDLQDLKLRLLTRLLALPAPRETVTGSNAVIVARNLTPSLVVRLDPVRVAAIATEEGTRTSHWAILARSLRIPTVVGLAGLLERTRDRQAMIVDGASGRVVIEPGRARMERFERRRAEMRGWREEEAGPQGGEGLRVTLRANLDLPGDARRARGSGAAGVGLLRSEFLVAGRNRAPGEEEQYAAYREVAESFPGHPVLVRTFDLGGDKFPAFLRAPFEENPLLGRRGVRVCVDEPELFRVQLRALLRAALHGEIRVMIPMVNGAGEVGTVRQLLAEAGAALDRAGVARARKVAVGAMIETPAAALGAATLAAQTDFLSVGTNDLVQYTLAVDRTNTRLAHIYDSLHPAVLSLVARVVRAGRAAGIEVSVCGEMAGRPSGALALAGLGVEVLSVAWPALPEIRRLLRTRPAERIRQAAAAALAAEDAGGARRALAGVLGD